EQVAELPRQPFRSRGGSAAASRTLRAHSFTGAAALRRRAISRQTRVRIPNGKRPCVELCHRGLRGNRAVAVPTSYPRPWRSPTRKQWLLAASLLGESGRAAPTP